MREVLTWQAGKFVYARGSEVPLHFMPLQKFSLETAQDLSLLVALRMHRVEKQDALLKKIEIARWRDTLALDVVAEIVFRNMAGVDSIIDIGSFNGLQFEEIKAKLAGQSGTPAYRIYFPEGMKRHAFQALHGGDDWAFNFIEKPPTAVHKNEISIVNCAAGIRLGHPICDEWKAFVRSGAPNIVLVLNASDANVTEERTTVFGQNAVIPPIRDVKNFISSGSGRWRARWLAKHDHQFFLPGDGQIGLLIASNLPIVDLAGFRLIEGETNG